MARARDCYIATVVVPSPKAAFLDQVPFFSSVSCSAGLRPIPVPIQSDDVVSLHTVPCSGRRGRTASADNWSTKPIRRAELRWKRRGSQALPENTNSGDCETIPIAHYHSSFSVRLVLGITVCRLLEITGAGVRTVTYLHTLVCVVCFRRGQKRMMLQDILRGFRPV